MTRPPPRPTTPVALPQVWPDLPGDLQQRAVRLLAQLAYAQFRRYTLVSTQETYHDRYAQQPQGAP